MRLQPGALQQRTPMRSRCDVTMDAIKSYILRERLQPGDLLPTEVELCEAVGASRSSVREAVRKLEGLNIVNVEHGRGTFVGSLSLDPMVETLAFRSMVSVGKNFDDLADIKGAHTKGADLKDAPVIDVTSTLRPATSGKEVPTSDKLPRSTIPDDLRANVVPPD